MSTRILAISTATEACSAALMVDDDLLLERFAIAPREHTKYILPMVNSLLTEADLELNALDALAFSQGPGSFTGVRIGIGIAQGLAIGSKLPLIGVSTLAVLAQGAWRRTGVSQILTAIDARMGEVYWAEYQRKKTGEWVCHKKETTMTPAALSLLNVSITGCWATAGTGWKTYPSLINGNQLELIPGHTPLAKARDILPLALHHFHRGDAKDVSLAEPTYLRKAIT